MKISRCLCNLCGQPIMTVRDMLLDGISLEFAGPAGAEGERFKVGQDPNTGKHLCSSCLIGLRKIFPQSRTGGHE